MTKIHESEYKVYELITKFIESDGKNTPLFQQALQLHDRYEAEILGKPLPEIEKKTLEESREIDILLDAFYSRYAKEDVMDSKILWHFKGDSTKVTKIRKIFKDETSLFTNQMMSVNESGTKLIPQESMVIDETNARLEAMEAFYSGKATDKQISILKTITHKELESNIDYILNDIEKREKQEGGK